MSFVFAAAALASAVAASTVAASAGSDARAFGALASSALAQAPSQSDSKAPAAKPLPGAAASDDAGGGVRPVNDDNSKQDLNRVPTADEIPYTDEEVKTPDPVPVYKNMPVDQD